MEILIIYLIEILIIMIFIMLSALFSGSETAYTTIDEVTLMRLVREKKIKEEDMKYWAKSSSMIPTLLVGNNIVNITASSIATVLAIRIAQALPNFSENIMVTISTATITVLIIIFGEILPKVLMRVNAEKTIPYLLYFMKICHLIFKPITFLMDKITTFIMNYLVPKKLRNPEKRSALASMDDIATIIDMGHKEGIIKESTHELLTGVIDFRSKTVEDIMTPRVDMVCIEAETDINDIIQLTVETGLSRFPVYEETIDHIIGIFHTRSLFKDYLKSNKNTKTKNKAIDYIMLPYFIPETKTISSLFNDMQKKKLQMAITIDEYGGTSGLVTMEDIVEEIMGDIEDESDKKEEDLIKFKGKRIIVNGTASIEEINEVLNWNIEEHEEYQTIAGYVIDKLDHIPETNERLILNGYRIRIMKIEDRRIIEMEFTPIKNIRIIETNEEEIKNIANENKEDNI
ncbi:HlyC/CorC family transporter [Brachyspira aalborgi]|jgi:putative hemolysin|uniref:HlyC/CorC family transporter n=1 Tax=Brachyspira aalborgi TaxID=29522 RepID=A0A5C8DSD0_9SPIR|nr:hemolysin family protein [Brachyspira aalborgi]MBS4764027.1 HlyC/CorC family transporter [Brachyspira sp.]CCY77285.1 hemolysin protein [Brachyspira sp. CAG:700]TXJ16987.1 HlyC/CorC family transporter [Brachyspira aalborgi]TXJ28647.1 HlyC/CorC family transporter [Brachyspira aalborgi]TXJ34563.1 HlyC/CorC family transporter [Brachyspira aalborgi]